MASRQSTKRKSAPILRLVADADNPGAPKPLHDEALEEVLKRMEGLISEARLTRAQELQRQRDIAVFLSWAYTQGVVNNYLARRKRFPSVMRRIHTSIDTFRKQYGYQKTQKGE